MSEPPTVEQLITAFEGAVERVYLSGNTVESVNAFNETRAALAAKVEALELENVALYNFRPTPEQINALPEALREYIHRLETISDPASDQAALICATDNVMALTKRKEELERQNAALAERVKELEAAVHEYVAAVDVSWGSQRTWDATQRLRELEGR